MENSVYFYLLHSLPGYQRVSLVCPSTWQKKTLLKILVCGRPKTEKTKPLSVNFCSHNTHHFINFPKAKSETSKRKRKKKNKKGPKLHRIGIRGVS